MTANRTLYPQEELADIGLVLGTIRDRLQDLAEGITTHGELPGDRSLMGIAVVADMLQERAERAAAALEISADHAAAGRPV